MTYTPLKWCFFIVKLALMGVYGWHLLIVEKYHWLSNDQLDQIRVIITFMVIGYIGYLWIMAVKDS